MINGIIQYLVFCLPFTHILIYKLIEVTFDPVFSFQLIHYIQTWASLVAQWSRIHLPRQETQVWSLGQEDFLGKEMATHSSIFAGKYHGKRRLVVYSPWGPKYLRQNLVTKQQQHSNTEFYLYFFIWIGEHIWICLCLCILVYLE